LVIHAKIDDDFFVSIPIVQYLRIASFDNTSTLKSTLHEKEMLCGAWG
jgi:hypothetical protein